MEAEIDKGEIDKREIDKGVIDKEKSGEVVGKEEQKDCSITEEEKRKLIESQGRDQNKRELGEEEGKRGRVRR